MENSGHSFTEGYSEGSEPIKLTEESILELFVSIYPPFRACFRIGVQTFSVCDHVEKKEAEWFVERLRSAFKTLEEYQLKQRDETIKQLKEALKEMIDIPLKSFEGVQEAIDKARKLVTE